MMEAGLTRLAGTRPETIVRAQTDKLSVTLEAVD
jgi:hypothetical protein